MRHSNNETHGRGKRGPAPEWARYDGFGPRGRRGFGGPPFGPPFGGPPFGPPGRRGGRGGRPRGDVRIAILVLLNEQPRHGYDLIRAIEERSDGSWSPSPGSIYPTLQALEDEGLLTIDNVEGRKTASLTDAGREWVAENAPEGNALFEAQPGMGSSSSLMQEMRGVAEAAMHVSRDPQYAERATAILATARKELYRLLADD